MPVCCFPLGLRIVNSLLDSDNDIEGRGNPRGYEGMYGRKRNENCVGKHDSNAQGKYSYRLEVEFISRDDIRCSPLSTVRIMRS